MAREGITYEQVSAVADALVGAGQSPTIKGVREALGTGSPNTVHRHLVAWRAARPVAQATARTLPGPIIDAIGQEIHQATDIAGYSTPRDLQWFEAEPHEECDTRLGPMGRPCCKAFPLCSECRGTAGSWHDGGHGLGPNYRAKSAAASAP